MKEIIIYIFFLLLPAGILSQDLSGLREKSILAGSDTLKIDNQIIVPGSVRLIFPHEKEFEDSLFSVDEMNSLIYFHPEFPWYGKELKIRYRVFTSDPTLEVSRKDTSLIIPFQNPNEDDPRERYSYQPVSDNIWKEETLVRSGSISRGISFGNNQDVIVNSNLNLQLSGKLDDNINIVASISDQNIPLQPDGYSQQINEFDKIFIQLYNDRLSLTAGDFEVTGSSGKFLPLDNKAQGIRFSSVHKPGRGPFTAISNSTSAAIAKGQYHRNIFNGIEGNQGPYKLRGPNNEPFIIILAGTERVYIDGRLLTRGVDGDYVIDYNLAEVKFTSRMPITKDRRIQIEFEFSDRNYARFMVANTTDFSAERGNYFVNVFSLHDARNQPIMQDLTEEEKELLAGTGDNLENAWVSKVDSIEFRNDIVLYMKTDTIVEGITYNIYSHSVDASRAFFSPAFSFVGEQKGNYIPENNSANGRVFRWVAPVNGIPSGSHEPVTLLIAPEKKQVVSMGGNTSLSANTEGFFELALSNNDKNTFSGLDNNDNTGLAFRIGIDNNMTIGKEGHELGGGIHYEFSGKQFTTTKRYNPVEYERDWNISALNERGDEQRVGWHGIYRRNLQNFLQYNGEYLDLGNNYSGLMNSLNAGTSIAGFDGRLFLSYMNSGSEVYDTDFIKYLAEISRPLWFFTIGLQSAGENNVLQDNTTKLLAPSSSGFRQWEVWMRNPDTTRFHIFTSYREREDMLPNDARLVNSSFAREISAGFASTSSGGNHLSGTVHHRILEPSGIIEEDLKPENSLNGRLETRFRLLEGTVLISGFYETGSGMELKKDFMFVEVARGRGTHTWADYNENGIKELDEFEPAAFPDQAQFVRIFIPGDDFIRTRSNQFSQSIRLNPPADWRESSGLKKFLSFFSNQGAYQSGHKTRQPQLIAGLNPFYSNLADTNLINITSSLRNTLKFQPSNKRFTIEYLHQNNKSKSLLVNGFDVRYSKSDAIHSRVEARPDLILSNMFEIGAKSFRSGFFPGRNFDIETMSGGVSVSFQPGFLLQASLHLNMKRQKNSPGQEVADNYNAGTEINYTISSKGNLILRADYFHIMFDSPVNTPLAWEMLEGLKPGNNMTFTLQAEQNLTESLQLSLNYNGRATPGNRFIHTGGMQMRAYF